MACKSSDPWRRQLSAKNLPTRPDPWQRATPPPAETRRAVTKPGLLYLLSYGGLNCIPIMPMTPGSCGWPAGCKPASCSMRFTVRSRHPVTEAPLPAARHCCTSTATAPSELHGVTGSTSFSRAARRAASVSTERLAPATRMTQPTRRRLVLWRLIQFLDPGPDRGS